MKKFLLLSAIGYAAVIGIGAWINHAVPAEAQEAPAITLSRVDYGAAGIVTFSASLGYAVAQQRQIDPAPQTSADIAALCATIQNRYAGTQVLTNDLDILAAIETLACNPPQPPPAQHICFQFNLNITGPLTTDEIQSIRDGIDDVIPRIQEACALVMPK